MNEFSKFGLSNNLIEALDKEEITTPTDIQNESIPYLLEGLDVIGGAKTGTGKTFAYSIPLIERIDKDSKFVKALILCPTRELSLQVKVEIDKLIGKTGLKCEAIYGGESYVIQNKKLRSKPQIIIGTPGRIIDQMEKGNLEFSHVDYLVLDEADEMLKMGFEEDMETILKEVPIERQTALFSATLPPFVKKVSTKYMRDPKIVKIESKTMTVDLISQDVYYVMRDSKKDLLVRLFDMYEYKHIMIFSNTKAMVDELVVFLQNEGFMAEGLHGDLKQALRDRVMSQFRSGASQILVATDVAARGIDIDDIDLVINYDIPNENEIYVHRIGRTGRAGREGKAITISTSHGKGRIKDLERFTKTEMNVCEVPTIEKIHEANLKKLYLDIRESIDNMGESTFFDNMIRKFSKESNDPLPLIRGLMAMVHNKNARQYREIEVPKSKKERSSNDRKLKGKEKSREKVRDVKKNSSMPKFAILEVNLGSVDNIRPNQLVNLLHDDLKIHREHFGKILIDKTRTFFEVKSEALRFFDKKAKFNGKTLTFRQVDKKLK